MDDLRGEGMVTTNRGKELQAPPTDAGSTFAVAEGGAVGSLSAPQLVLGSHPRCGGRPDWRRQATAGRHRVALRNPDPGTP